MLRSKTKYFQIGMLVLNFITVILISVFVYLTTESIRSHYRARQFLNEVKHIPPNALNDVVLCMALLLVLALTMLVRSRRSDNSRIVFTTFVLDFIASFIIIITLNFNYNGLLLLVFANVVMYASQNRMRYLFTAFGVFSFLFTNFDLMSIRFNLYVIGDYVAYHDIRIQPYILGLYNGIISINIMLFILFSINEINIQRGTIDEASELYQKLSEANVDLESANTRLREYAAITEKMGETRERNRLAREIHDTLGHTLTGISFGIDAAITTLQKDSEKETLRQLNVISHVTRQGIHDVRQSVSKLRVDSLDKFGLENSITQIITNLQNTAPAKIYFSNSVVPLKFQEDVENAIYRIVQESLTNAVRHGSANNIWVDIKKSDDSLLLTIKDDGVGSKEIKSGFGLRHIGERVDMLGGKVSFGNSDGFLVSVVIPLRWSDNDD